MKKDKQLTDLPIRYQRLSKNWWIDTQTNTRLPDSLIHTKTKSYAIAKEKSIMDKRWDLKL